LEKLKARLLLIFLVCFPILLFVLPATYFDTGQTICPSKALLDIDCLGCGMTRAIQHLIHFDFEAAYNFNKLSFLVFPILVVVWCKQTINAIKQA
jgi:Protein of unknown function (DUF2752)